MAKGAVALTVEGIVVRSVDAIGVQTNALSLRVTYLIGIVVNCLIYRIICFVAGDISGAP